MGLFNTFESRSLRSWTFIEIGEKEVVKITVDRPVRTANSTSACSSTDSRSQSEDGLAVVQRRNSRGHREDSRHGAFGSTRKRGEQKEGGRAWKSTSVVGNARHRYKGDETHRERPRDRSEYPCGYCRRHTGRARPRYHATTLSPQSLPASA